MCGIAGLACGPHGRIDPAFVPTATRLMRDRGPDDAGYLLYSRASVKLGREWSGDAADAEVALVHRRLSILDLTDAGWQPMSSADGRYHIVFNGEIYNFIELRRELEALGHTFRSRCDTEVLLAAYAQWGSGALRRFVGMFAFAILDTRERRIFLARDFFGIKPLYYTFDRGKLAFASEIKVLLEMGCSGRRVNPQCLYEYLRHGGTDFGGQTLLTDVSQLPLAHYIDYRLDDMEPPVPICYWKLDLDRTVDISFDEAARRLRDLFLKNVELHLRSDVPVGTALSGGIDSSAIVAVMRHLQGRNLDLHTFSFVADDPKVSEEKWVDIAAEAAGAVVHKVRIKPSDLIADLERLVNVQDEPFGSTSIYAQFRVFRLVKEAGIKVMLDGQGADEVLAGYRWYLGARLASLVRQGKWSQALGFYRRAAKLPDMSKRRLFAMLGEFLLPNSLHSAARRLIGRDFLPSWMNAAWFTDRGVRPSSPDYSGTNQVLKACLAQAVTKWNLPHLLRYEDRNSMAFSIESRVPFLTPEFVEFAFSLPEEYILVPDGTTKAVFREAMRGIVPDAILDRKDKMGFVTPERSWLGESEAWVNRALAGETARRIPVLNMAAVDREWEKFKVQGTYGMPPWRWLNLIEWTRQFNVRFD
jgi:asparagine synthase (glutamine-hydrolysing)